MHLHLIIAITDCMTILDTMIAILIALIFDQICLILFNRKVYLRY